MHHPVVSEVVVAAAVLVFPGTALAATTMTLTTSEYSGTFELSQREIYVPALEKAPPRISARINRAAASGAKPPPPEEQVLPTIGTNPTATVTVDGTAYTIHFAIVRPFVVPSSMQCPNAPTPNVLILTTPPPAGGDRSLKLCSLANDVAFQQITASGTPNRDGREDVTVRAGIRMGDVDWQPVLSDMATARVTILYWPKDERTRAMRPRPGKNREAEYANGVEQDFCVSLPAGWKDPSLEAIVASQRLPASGLTLRAGFSTAAVAEHRTTWVRTYNGQYCPTVSTDTTLGDALAKAVLADVSHHGQAKVELVFQSPQFQQQSFNVADAFFVVRPRFTAGALVKASRQISSYDVNLPLAEAAEKVCLRPDSSDALGPTVIADATSFTIENGSYSPISRFSGTELTLNRQTVTDANGQTGTWYCASLAGAQVLAAPTGVIAVRYEGERFGEVPSKNYTFYLAGNAVKQTHLEIGSHTAIAGATWRNIPTSSFVARAHVPIIGGGVGVPDQFHFVLDAGFAMGVRLSSEKGETITGLSLGAYASVCLKLQTKLTPRACLSLVPEFVGGPSRTVVTPEGTPQTYDGTGAQVGWMLTAGAL
jgi:hypothetical protein